MSSPLEIVSGAVQAASAVKQGQNAVAMSEYNYKTDVENANLAVQQGNEEARRSNVIANKVIGQGRAAAGASGIQMSGSALDVIGASAANAELDALSIQHKAAIKAYGYRSSAALEPFKQNVARENAQMATAGAIIGAGAKAYSYGNAGSKSGEGYGGGED
jgi:hypothetical protein